MFPEWYKKCMWNFKCLAKTYSEWVLEPKLLKRRKFLLILNFYFSDLEIAYFFSWGNKDRHTQSKKKWMNYMLRLKDSLTA